MHLLFPRTHSERVQHQKFLRRDPAAAAAHRQDRGQGVHRRAGRRAVRHPDVLVTAAGFRRERTRTVAAAVLPQGRPRLPPDDRGARRGPAPWGRIERRVDRWLSSTYGPRAASGSTRRIPRRVIVEQRIGEPGALPDDYKFWVFQGRVHYIHWFTDRGLPTYGGRIVDRDWQEPFRSRSQRTHERFPPRPESLGDDAVDRRDPRPGLPLRARRPLRGRRPPLRRRAHLHAVRGLPHPRPRPDGLRPRPPVATSPAGSASPPRPRRPPSSRRRLPRPSRTRLRWTRARSVSVVARRLVACDL